MRSSTLSLILSAGSALVSAAKDVDTTVVGHPNYTVSWTPSDCVAPQAFSQCLSTANTDYQNRTSTCNEGDTLALSDHQFVDCSEHYHCESLTDQLNCAMSFCWNRVYSCEYQRVAMDMSQFCETARHDSEDEDEDENDQDAISSMWGGIPYFPAPDDAPGGCSCNLASTREAVDLVLLNATSCGDTGDQEYAYGYSLDQPCSCCAYSGAMSTFYSKCPTTDPKEYGMDNLITARTGNFNFTFSSCDTILGSADCAASLGIESSSIPLSFLNDAALSTIAASATGTLSNLAGQMTSPASGYTLTWTANYKPYTVTATSTIVAPLSTSGSKTTGSATGSAVSGSASPSTSGNAAVRVEAGAWFAAGIVAVVAHL